MPTSSAIIEKAPLASLWLCIDESTTFVSPDQTTRTGWTTLDLDNILVAVDTRVEHDATAVETLLQYWLSGAYWQLCDDAHRLAAAVFDDFEASLRLAAFGLVHCGWHLRHTPPR